MQTTAIDELVSNETDVISVFLEFACLESAAMATIIEKMHKCIYGECTIKFDMWTTTELLCWFRFHYEYDPIRQQFTIIKENKVFVH